MTNRELKDIIEKIQVKEGIKPGAIAQKAGVNRSYLSTLLNNIELKDVEPAFLGKIINAFPQYFNEHKQTISNRSDKLDSILFNLNELQNQVAAILTGQVAGNETIMNSLDRLEKNPVGTLAATADRLALQIAKRLNVIQTGKKVGVGK